MTLYDRGTGPPLIVVQPLQGRWQWMRPALAELSKQVRVISYTLAGDLGSGERMEPSAGFEVFVRQLERVIDRTRLGRVALCGVSFGGAIAIRYAATRPEQVTRLIVASSPGPGWMPSESQASYVARPWLSMPSFTVGGLRRASGEITTSLPARSARLEFSLRYLGTAVRFPMMPHLMARRVRLLQQLDLAADCARITAPTLVITGEAALDRVVPVSSTREYVTRIPGARHAIMEGTGHLGSLTQPVRFAQIVGEFVNASSS
jgi:3-oxoadipate enol-lactonase